MQRLAGPAEELRASRLRGRDRTGEPSAGSRGCC